MTITVERIFQLMNKRGMQQKELAEILGTSQSVLSDWKSAKRNLNPSFEQIKTIANYFDVTTDYLLGNSNHPKVEVIPADPEKVKKREAQEYQMIQDSRARFFEEQKKIALAGLTTAEAIEVIAKNEFGPNPTQEQLKRLRLALRLVMEQEQDTAD